MKKEMLLHITSTRPFGSLTKMTGDYAVNYSFRFSSEYFDPEIKQRLFQKKLLMPQKEQDALAMQKVPGLVFKKLTRDLIQ